MYVFLAAYRSLGFYARAADITNDAAISCASAWLMMFNREIFRIVRSNAFTPTQES